MKSSTKADILFSVVALLLAIAALIEFGLVGGLVALAGGILVVGFLSPLNSMLDDW